MALALIEPDKPGWEQRTFECQNCGHTQSSVVEIQVKGYANRVNGTGS